MLGIVSYVFGHQESIAAISLTLNATNSSFIVDLEIFRKIILVSLDNNMLSYLMGSLCGGVTTYNIGIWFICQVLVLIT